MRLSLRYTTKDAGPILEALTSPGLPHVFDLGGVKFPATMVSVECGHWVTLVVDVDDGLPVDLTGKVVEAYSYPDRA